MIYESFNHICVKPCCEEANRVPVPPPQPSPGISGQQQIPGCYCFQQPDMGCAHTECCSQREQETGIRQEEPQGVYSEG